MRKPSFIAVARLLVMVLSGWASSLGSIAQDRVTVRPKPGLSSEILVQAQVIPWPWSNSKKWNSLARMEYFYNRGWDRLDSPGSGLRWLSRDAEEPGGRFNHCSQLVYILNY
jgi:hypothetical protein